MQTLNDLAIVMKVESQWGGFGSGTMTKLGNLLGEKVAKAGRTGEFIEKFKDMIDNGYQSVLDTIERLVSRCDVEEIDLNEILEACDELMVNPRADIKLYWYKLMANRLNTRIPQLTNNFKRAIKPIEAPDGKLTSVPLINEALNLSNEMSAFAADMEWFFIIDKTVSKKMKSQDKTNTELLVLDVSTSMTGNDYEEFAKVYLLNRVAHARLGNLSFQVLLFGTSNRLFEIEVKGVKYNRFSVETPSEVFDALEIAIINMYNTDGGTNLNSAIKFVNQTVPLPKAVTLITDHESRADAKLDARCNLTVVCTSDGSPLKAMCKKDHFFTFWQLAALMR